MIPLPGRPTRTQLLIGAIAGAMACLAELFQVDGPGGTHLSLVPAILMMAEVTGGWAAAAIGIVVLACASLLWKAQAIALLLTAAVVAAFCARAVRAGVPPLVSVLLI